MGNHNDLKYYNIDICCFTYWSNLNKDIIIHDIRNQITEKRTYKGKIKKILNTYQ